MLQPRSLPKSWFCPGTLKTSTGEGIWRAYQQNMSLRLLWQRQLNFESGSAFEGAFGCYRLSNAKYQAK
jgi:hypothetical protein